MKKGAVFSFIVICLIAAAALAYWYRHDLSRATERALLPEETEYGVAQTQGTLPVAEDGEELIEEPTPTEVAATETPPANLPKEVNLAVPFTPQAPHANWDLPYKEFCEEASVLMAIRYIQNQPIANPDIADQELLKIKAFEEKRLGEYLDTNVADTALILTEHFQYGKVRLVENPAAGQLREALAAGKLIIMPAAGRLLGNPYFQTPGPLYHMLVIKGYTADGRFITNDPGTRRGQDFIYSEAALMNAMHDWRDDEQIQLGRKVVIIVG